MADEYKVHILTTADPSGATITQDALEQTAQKASEITDAVTKGDRATAALEAKLRTLSPEQVARVEAEMKALAAAEEAAGRDASALNAQLERITNIRVDKQASAIGSIFGGVTAGTLAAEAITKVTAAIGEHLHASIELADQLDDLSGRAGVTASELQRIGNVAAENNGNIQQTADALSKVQISAQGALAGSKPLEESFGRLGITLDELKSLSPDQLFYKIADSVAASNDRGRSYADVVGVMGRSSKDLFTTLERGSEQIKAAGDAIGVFSDETIKDLAKAKDSLAAFQNQLTIFAGETIEKTGSIYQGLVGGYAEAFQGLTDLIAGSSTDLRKFDDVNDRMAATADKAKKAIQDEGDEVSTLGDKAEGAAAKIKAIDAAFAERSFKELPISLQLDTVAFKISNLRAEAAKELPGTLFRSAAELNAAAGAITDDDARLKLKQLAQEYAKLEDQTKSLGEAQKASADQTKAAADAARKQSTEAAAAVAAEIKALQEKQRLLLAEITSPDTDGGRRKQAIAELEELNQKLKELLQTQGQAPKKGEAGLESWLLSIIADAKASQVEIDNAIRALQRLYAEQNKAPKGNGIVVAPAPDGSIANRFDSFDKVDKDRYAPGPGLFPSSGSGEFHNVKQSADAVQSSISEMGNTTAAGFADMGTAIKEVHKQLTRQITATQEEVRALARQI